MADVTRWGTISSKGSIDSSSGGFSITHQKNGEYIISFSPPFSSSPTIVGSQRNYGSSQSTLDNVIFPFVNSGSATAITGDSRGEYTDRSFSFIAIGSAN